MGKLVKSVQGNGHDEMVSIDYLTKLEEIGHTIREKRKKIEGIESPKQYIKEKPGGGGNFEFIESPYMFEKIKELCNEHLKFEVKDLFVKDILKKDGTFFGQAFVAVTSITDLNLGNAWEGASCKSIAYKTGDGEPVDLSNDVATAVTESYKQCCKYAGISSDVYKRRVIDLTPETQKRLNESYDKVMKAWGKGQLENWRKKIDNVKNTNEDEIINQLNKLDKALEESNNE